MRLLDALDEAIWSASALSAAAESGLIHHLRDPVTPDEIGRRLGMPPAMVEGLLDVLGGFGLVRRDGDRVCAAPGLEPFTSAEGARRFQSALRAPLLQTEDLRRRAGDRNLDLNGWRFEDERIIEAQGALTGLWVEQAVPKLRFLPGLESSLSRPGAALLDVGAGAAGLSIALCQHFPLLKAVAMEPATAPANIGERHVREAGLHDRIEIRRERVEHLEERAAFDLVFLPQMFLPDTIIELSTRAVFRALKPGGWLLAAVLSRPGGDVGSSVARLKNLLWGGNVRDGDALKPILMKAGFDPVIRAPGAGVIRMICARRPPA